ncbi:ATP-binding protein [Myxococcota bacterium]|nr:ATP-binding protein [Myxococcota bacterium]
MTDEPTNSTEGLLDALGTRPGIVRSAFELAPMGIAVLDGREHRYALVNAAYEAFARGKGPLVGRTITDVWPELEPRTLRLLDEVFETGRPYRGVEEPVSMERDGRRETLWLTFSFLPLAGASGAVERILVMVQDVTEHVRAIRAAEALAAQLEASIALTAALSSAHTQRDVARAVLERGLPVLGADAGAVALLRADDPAHAEIIDHFGYPDALVDVWRRVPLALASPLTDSIRSGEPVWVGAADEALARYPDWAPAVIDGPDRAWAALPLVLRGRVVGALGLAFHGPRSYEPEEQRLFLSVAERCAQALDRARALDERRESDARLRLALAAGRMGIFDADMETRRVTTSETTDRIFGVTEDGSDGAPLDPYLRRIHRDDAPRVRDTLQAAAARGEDFALEVRVVRAGGTIVWVQCRGELVTRDGKIRRVRGALLDVTESVRAREALRKSEERARARAEDLRNADRQKTNFIALLSHELRNPLAPIRNALVLLDRSDPGSTLDTRARAILHRQVEHIGRLVDDLLDVNRLQRGSLELRVARVDACLVLTRAVDDLRAVYEERGVRLFLDRPSEPLWVDADPARLAQMIGNLLNNALKFTPPGGRVEVSMRPAGAELELVVRDTGAGIEPAELERIFEPFAQAERTRKQSQGLGIGLALVRELARKQGGAVRADSKGVGSGATLTLTLPLAPAPAATPADETAHDASSRRILIVEDNADAATTLSDVLQILGHTTRVAMDGSSALRAIDEEAPEVILCDIGLPDMTGYDVVRTLRANPANHHVYAVALTGYTQPNDKDEALRAGFDLHLAKPPALADLEGALEEATRRLARR